MEGERIEKRKKHFEETFRGAGHRIKQSNAEPV